MIRKIVTIDKERCNGCGLCAQACHEGAIGIVAGKAQLLREDYCDGLGDCLPACPMNAISFEMREAPAYDQAAVFAAKVKRLSDPVPVTCGAETAETMATHSGGCLNNFPVQIKLIPENAVFLSDCDLLIAADCCAYACGSFHTQIMKDKITMIGCPKLDGESYAEKFHRIFSQNHIRSVTIARMTVPCCGGLTYAVKKGLELSGKDIPLEVITIHPQGEIHSSEVGNGNGT